MGIFTALYNWGSAQIKSFYLGPTFGLTACNPSLPSRPEKTEEAGVAEPAPSASAPPAASAATAPALACSEEAILQCIDDPANKVEQALRAQIMGQICIVQPMYMVGNSPDSVVLILANNKTGEARANQGAKDVALRIYGTAINFFTDKGGLPEGVTIELELPEGVSGKSGIGEAVVEVEEVTVNDIQHKVLKITFNVEADAAVGPRNIVIKLAGEEIGRADNAFEVAQRAVGGAGPRTGGYAPAPAPAPAQPAPAGNPFEL